MKKLVVILPLLALAVLASCSQRGFKSNVQVTPAPVPNVDFTHYKTWHFGRPGQYPDTGVEHMDTPQFREAVAKHFGAEMTSLGYVYADSNPDLTFLMHVATAQQADQQKMDDIYKGYDMAWSQLDENDVWHEGTLIIFCMDSKTGQQVWSSSAQAKMQDYVGYQDRLDRFNKVVTMMMDYFPIHSSVPEKK